MCRKKRSGLHRGFRSDLLGLLGGDALDDSPAGGHRCKISNVGKPGRRWTQSVLCARAKQNVGHGVRNMVSVSGCAVSDDLAQTAAVCDG